MVDNWTLSRMIKDLEKRIEYLSDRLNSINDPSKVGPIMELINTHQENIDKYNKAINRNQAPFRIPGMENKPKRGRGRPKGSKSTYRKIPNRTKKIQVDEKLVTRTISFPESIYNRLEKLAKFEKKSFSLVIYEVLKKSFDK